MNNNNSEVNGMVFALALVGVFLLFAAIFVGVILALYSLFLTGVCFWAWNEPRTIFKETIKPSEARCFVYSGIVGAFTSPFAVAIVAQMANVRIDDDYIFLILLGGYARRYYRHLYGSATRVELCFSEDNYGYIVWPDAIFEHDTAKKYFGIPVKFMQNHFSDGSPANTATCPKKNGSMGVEPLH